MFFSSYSSGGTLALVCLIASAGSTSSSCSSSEKKPDSSAEASEILDLINEGQSKIDPKGCVEVDLGKFRVTHAVADSQDEALLLVDFQLYGVLPEGRREALDHTLPTYNNRLRDAVISLVQSTDTEHLTDPSLAFFKAELVTAINRVLQERLVKDVVFSNFSVHDAHEAPFPSSSPEAPKKKPAGGHGGHH
jgi:flagellar basal body-associated protein FliL